MEQLFQNLYQDAATLEDGVIRYTLGGNSWHHHEFSGVTTVVQGHKHDLIGYTEAVFACSSDLHTHVFTVTTTDEHGHTHAVSGRTGPPIHLPYGGHIHTFTLDTEPDETQNHTHSCRGRTRDLIIKNIFE